MDSISFRAAYSSGVGTYYTQNASTYRNPHESGVTKSLRAILEVLIPPNHPPPARIFDLSSGSGEATLGVIRFLQAHRPTLASSAIINASDPYTHELYATRTGLPCGNESFKDILLEGGLKGGKYDVVICSFALHLCSKGEIWGLLYALSLSSRWFVVLAPGKGPEVGADTGWERKGKEIMVERVRGRVYRSLNFMDDQGERGGYVEKLGIVEGGEDGEANKDNLPVLWYCNTGPCARLSRISSPWKGAKNTPKNLRSETSKKKKHQTILREATPTS